MRQQKSFFFFWLDSPVLLSPPLCYGVLLKLLLGFSVSNLFAQNKGTQTAQKD